MKGKRSIFTDIASLLVGTAFPHVDCVLLSEPPATTNHASQTNKESPNHFLSCNLILINFLVSEKSNTY